MPALVLVRFLVAQCGIVHVLPERRAFADEQEAAVRTAGGNPAGGDRGGGEIGRREERAEVRGCWRCAAGRPGQRIRAQDRRALARLAVEAGGRVERVEDQRRVRGLAEALPGQDATRLVRAREAGDFAADGTVLKPGDDAPIP